ncbi:MAG TPA: glycogen/starch/alpha-glucan phosphorylase, partial [Verrucomicrobiae bacterium]|nr:glycogen/starch/alpha-glucan phosphorylase [Verrucomicrobiae bacterium]
KSHGYRPWEYYNADEELKEAISQINSGFFSPGQPDLFRPLVDSLLGYDTYMLLADYRAYVDCQDRVAALYEDQDAWARMSILNTARMGYFSSDRTIREYCQEIWNVESVLPDEPDAAFAGPLLQKA